MNKLQLFIASCGFGGFVTEKQMPELIAIDRLAPLLVRCGGKRFTCAAQDLAPMLAAVEAGGDYVRDVSFPVGSMERAEHWRPEVVHVHAKLSKEIPVRDFNLPSGAINPGLSRFINDVIRNTRELNRFDESDCGGVFDGHGVVSDADPGL